MRVVFDSNVLIAAFLTRGACAGVLEHCLAVHEVVVGERVSREVAGKLRDKLGFPPQQVAAVVRFLRGRCTMVGPVALPAPVCRDPDDDHVLAVAAECGAELLLSADKDLLVLREHEGTAIVHPRDFWRAERERLRS